MNKIILVVLFIGAALAQPPNYSNYQSAGQDYQFGAAGFRANVASLESDRSSYGSGYSRRTTQESEPARYQFKYDINDQVELGHEEQRDGDNTSGSYYVVLPDGRRQIVQYTADSDGYHPVISYEDVSSGRTGNRQNYQTNSYQSGRNTQNGY